MTTFTCTICGADSRFERQTYVDPADGHAYQCCGDCADSMGYVREDLYTDDQGAAMSDPLAAYAQAVAAAQQASRNPAWTPKQRHAEEAKADKRKRQAWAQLTHLPVLPVQTAASRHAATVARLSKATATILDPKTKDAERAKAYAERARLTPLAVGYEEAHRRLVRAGESDAVTSGYRDSRMVATW